MTFSIPLPPSRGRGGGGERRWSKIVIGEAVAKGLKYPKIKFEKEESYEKTQVDPNLFLVFTLYGSC